MSKTEVKQYELLHLKVLYMEGPKDKDGRNTNPVNFRDGKLRTNNPDVIDYLSKSKFNNVQYKEVETEPIKEGAVAAMHIDGTQDTQVEPSEENAEKANQQDDAQSAPEVIQVNESVTNAQEAALAIKAIEPNFRGKSDATILKKAAELNLEFPNWK